MALSATEGERLSRLESAYEHLATKADVERVRTDLERLRAEVRTDVEGVRLDVERLRADVRTDVESLRSEFRGMKWIIVAGIAGAGAFASIISVAATLVTLAYR